MCVYIQVRAWRFQRSTWDAAPFGCRVDCFSSFLSKQFSKALPALDRQPIMWAWKKFTHRFLANGCSPWRQNWSYSGMRLCKDEADREDADYESRALHHEQWWLWKNPAPKMPEVESMSICAIAITRPWPFPFIHIPQPFFPSSVSFEENMNLLAKEPRCSFLLRSASEQSLCDSTKADWGTLFEPVPLKWATELLSWSSSA